jgi:carbonic anhydrase/acetyltransferase-like protein (isoleucine patch superfamily)
MTIRAFEEISPRIAKTAYVDPSAVVIGDVEIGNDSSIWPMTVIRGDVNRIRIGERTSIQDNSVIHVTHAGIYHPGGHQTIIGNDVTVGHRVILHGCEVKDHCLIGMGAILLDGAIVESHVIVGAGTLVSPNKVLESGYLWLGSPAKPIRKLTDREIEQIHYSANYYVQLKNRYITQ